MPSHARPTICKPLKPEDDWTRVKDPREKKRIQNRVAQRTYRHRMKARLGELQARLEQHEGPQPSHTTTHNETTTAGLSSLQCMQQQQNFPSPSPSELNKSLPRLDTNVFQFCGEPQDYMATLPSRSAGGHINSTHGHVRSHSLPPNYGLLSPPTHSDVSSAITPDALPCPSLNAQYADLSALPIKLEDLAAIPEVCSTQTLPPPSVASIGSPQMSDPGTVLMDPSATQPAVSFFDMPTAQMEIAAIENANQRFAESQAYECANQSQQLCDASSPQGSHITDWEGQGFQNEVLSMMESVIRVESSSARHDLIAKMAPMIESCDESGIYNPDILAGMKQSIQEDLPNSWAFTQAMSADGGAAWQADRSNIALASVMLMNFAGRISNEKLLCLVGGCL